MERTDILLAELSKVLSNLKKSPHRRYQKTTLIAKLNTSKTLYNEVLELAEILEENRLEFILKTARFLYGEIKIFIDSRLERTQLITFKALALSVFNFLKLHKSIKMAKVDIKTGTSLIEIFDGTSDKLESFLDSVSLFLDLTDNANETPAAKAAAKLVVTRFVRTRLSGVARQAVPENVTIEELIAALKEHCATKITSDNILAKLKSLKQTTSTNAFCEEVEKLTNQLKSIYISKKIPVDVATQMSTKSGIDALIRGTKNNESKIILKAGTFSKLHDAVQKLMENETEENSSTTSQILTASRVNNQNRGRGSNNYRGNRRGYSNSNRGHQNNFTRNNYSRGHYNNYRGNSNNRGYRNGTGYQNRGSGHRGHPNQGMFLMVQQPQNQPQQQNIPQIQQNLQGYAQIPINVPGPQQNFLGPSQGQFTQ